jgi:hypothetical protein
MWETQDLETITQKRLIKELGQSKGEEKYALYLTARKKLLEDVLEEIKGAQPSLTDHGPRHIANVLRNAYTLLGNQVDSLTATELYTLILSILFHDVGNILGRDGHQLNIRSIYDHVRPVVPPDDPYRQEKLNLFQIVAAHCGEAADKTNDTLQFLEPSHLDGRPVNLRSLAAILRLSDELAEGVQRTSLFMQRIHGYPEGSQIYHQYASITEVAIDRGGQRIALTYHPTIQADRQGLLLNEGGLREILQFAYKRLQKLDEERKYNKHYCSFLEPFKQVSAAFMFWVDGQPRAFGLRPLNLTDLVVPGDKQKEIPAYDQTYTVDNIIGRIQQNLIERREIHTP